MPELVLPVSGASADDAVTLAEPYLQLRHDGLVPLVAVQRRGEQAVAIWSDVGAGPLPPRLAPQQAVTVGRVLAGALASLHVRALVHGAVGADAVVRDAEGRPRLAGAGSAVWAGGRAAPADDVHGLARVLVDLVAGDVSAQAAAVRAALADALASHPAARPSATALAEALGAAAPPAALPRPPRGPGRAREPRRRRPDRVRGRVTAAMALVVVAAVALPVLVRRTGAARSGSPGPADHQPAPAWEAVVHDIAAARWAAFVRADAARLLAADILGGPAYRVDVQRVAAFSEAHAHVRGTAATPEVDQVLHAGTAVAELIVTEGVPAYDEVDDHGRVLAHHAATPPTRWRLTLVRTPVGWRTQEVAPA